MPGWSGWDWRWTSSGKNSSRPPRPKRRRRARRLGLCKHLGNQPAVAAIGTCPTLAIAATSGARVANTRYTPRRTSCAMWALRTRPQTDAPRRQRPLRLRLPLGWRVRRPPTTRSIQLRNPRTWGFSRSGRTPPPPIAAAERWARVCRAPSSRNPKRSARPRQIPAPMEPPPAIANAPGLLFPRRNRATPAAARTIRQRTQHPLSPTPPPSAIAHRARRLGHFQDWPFVMGLSVVHIMPPGRARSSVLATAR